MSQTEILAAWNSHFWGQGFILYTTENPALPNDNVLLLNLKTAVKINISSGNKNRNTMAG